MSYVNVGAVLLGFDEETGEDTRVLFKTKKALKEALAATPAAVLFTNTAHGLGPGEPQYRASELDSQYVYQLAGPDPYTNRKWYASVAVKNGKPVVIA